MSTELRPPTPSDYAVIASWIPDAAACHRWAGPRMPFPFAAAQLPSLLAVPGASEASYCFAEDYNPVRGFGQHWVLTTGTVHLGRIILAPEYRGKGVGRILCQMLISRAIQSTGAKAVTLRAYKDNVAAIALYSSLGFAVEEKKSTENALFMELSNLK